MARWTKEDIERIKSPQSKVVSRKIKTGDLTTHSLRALAMKGYEAWRNNSVGIWDPQKQVFRKNKAAKLGVSDVIGFHRRTGQFAACEIKNGKDTLSDDQRLFLEDVQRSGGLAMVVRTIDDIEKFMRDGTVNIQ